MSPSAPPVAAAEHAERLRAIKNPIEREKAARALLEQWEEGREVLYAVRCAAIRELAIAGWSRREIAQEVGLSAARVQQIAMG